MPPILPVLLLGAQVCALVAAIRGKLWKSVPAWVIYTVIVTIHVALGLVLADASHPYPIALVYFEPAIIVGQIAFAFESSLFYLGILSKRSSPERRLLVWLIPLVPAAIVLPIVISFVQDALTGWNGDSGESLRMVYGVRKFLSVTLLVILVAIPFLARSAGRRPQPAPIFHHRILTLYVACGALGYLCKAYLSGIADVSLTILFFVAGPLLCFALWARRMWNASPAEMEPVETGSRPESSLFERRRMLEPS